VTRRDVGGQRGPVIGAADYALANAVLMRDRTKTQYIVLPLAAGALARCILAGEPGDCIEPWIREMWPEWQVSARAVLDRCAPAEDSAWDTEPERYGLIADFATFAWPGFLRWTPIAWMLGTLGISATVPAAARAEAVERWLRRSPDRSLLHAMLVASHAFSNVCRPHEPPIHARGAQRVRVILAERLRQGGLTSWPRIVRAVSEDWNTATLERLAGEMADACDLLLLDPLAFMPDGGIELDDDPGFREEVDPENGSPAEPAPLASRDASAEALSTRVHHLERENDRLIEKVTRLQKERDHHVDRHAGAESRAEAIRAELVAARGRIAALELELSITSRARDELEDQRSVDETLATSTPVPADRFAGRRILLYTGAQAADTREAMRRSFFELGAQQVDCYYVDKDRGPDAFPENCLVVVDVTFMPHAVSDPIINRARASGVRCFPCRRGASLIAREVAARLALPARRS